MRRSVGASEIVALVLLAGLGMIVPIVGWIAGIVVLWSSRLWTVGEKLVATILTPVTVLIPVILVLDSSSDVCTARVIGGRRILHCGGGPSALSLSGGELLAIIALLVLVPILTAIVLYRRASGRAATVG